MSIQEIKSKFVGGYFRWVGDDPCLVKVTGLCPEFDDSVHVDGYDNLSFFYGNLRPCTNEEKTIMRAHVKEGLGNVLKL